MSPLSPHLNKDFIRDTATRWLFLRLLEGAGCWVILEAVYGEGTGLIQLLTFPLYFLANLAFFLLYRRGFILLPVVLTDVVVNVFVITVAAHYAGGIFSPLSLILFVKIGGYLLVYGTATGFFSVACSAVFLGLIATLGGVKAESIPWLSLALMGAISIGVLVAFRTILKQLGEKEASLRAETARTQEAVHETATLLKVAEALNSTLDRKELFSRLVRLATEAVGCDGAAISSWDKEKRVFRVMAVHGFSPPLQDEILKMEISPKTFPQAREALTQGILHVADRTAQEMLPADFLERMNASSLISLPITHGKWPLGLLVFVYHRPTASFFPDQIHRARGIAHHAAIALESVRAYEEIHVLHEQLKRESVYLKEEMKDEYKVEEVVGRSSAVKAVLEQVRRAAATGATVLLTGETGTGKELLARALHNLSPRREKLLVRINCAAIPETLLESELFGHEKGAFTGALSRHLGRFEVANGGTIFLDEVNSLSLPMQAKLLRVLEEKEILRIGGAEPIPVDVRVIAATNQDLQAAVKNGAFREDLFFRLLVVKIHVPPLRERKEDIPLLVSYFIERFNTQLGRQVVGIDEHSLEEMLLYSWPGSVRELKNVIERAMVMADPEERVISVGGFIQDFLDHTEVPARERPLPELVKEYKVALIRDALRQAGGNQRRAAELLGIYRPTLTRMIKELKIEV